MISVPCAAAQASPPPEYPLGEVANGEPDATIDTQTSTALWVAWAGYVLVFVFLWPFRLHTPRYVLRLGRPGPWHTIWQTQSSFELFCVLSIRREVCLSSSAVYVSVVGLDDPAKRMEGFGPTVVWMDRGSMDLVLGWHSRPIPPLRCLMLIPF